MTVNERNLKELGPYFIISTVDLWLRGIVMVGERLLDLNEKNMQFFPNAIDVMHHDKAKGLDMFQVQKSRDYVKKWINSVDLSSIEEHFFIYALDMALRWLTESIKVMRDFKCDIDKFFSQVPEA